MASRSIEQYHEILRSDLYAFTHRAFLPLNPNVGFLPHPYIELVATALDQVRRGKILRLIINLPPRSLKSTLASVVLPAWILGHNPSAQIICVSYAQDLADRLARECRSLMSMPFYQALFPTRLSRQKQATAEFETTQKGGRLSTSVGGLLTGRGADLLIGDDLLKPNEALSDSSRRAVNEWYDNTLYSRLNDKAHGAIVIVMQRLHEDDLVGHVLRQEPWEQLSFPAIAKRDEEYIIETPYGRRAFKRKAGEALHPEREPLEVLERIRQTIGPYNFAGQYQQEPAPYGGGIVKAEWFQTYDELPEFDTVVQSWDTASVAAELNSYSVCTTWGIAQKHLYLLHVFRKRLDYPDLKRAVRNQAQAHRANVVLIENRASGIQLIQELIMEGVRGITKYEPEGGDKVMRLRAQTALVEAGFVHLPREALWLADYLHELLFFPKGASDDQVDSTSQALDWIQSAATNSCAGWVEHTRRLYETLLGKPAPVLGGAPAPVTPIRVRAPEPYAAFYVSGINGRAGHYIADADGLIEDVHPEDVEALTASGCTRE
jgi:predicted phage terminase large subunit-like protein